MTYTCGDTAREGRNVLITLDPEDRHYDDVEALDDAGNVLGLCPEWRVERSSRGINSINIPVREETLDGDSCGCRKVIPTKTCYLLSVNSLSFTFFCILDGLASFLSDCCLEICQKIGRFESDGIGIIFVC